MPYYNIRGITIDEIQPKIPNEKNKIKYNNERKTKRVAPFHIQRCSIQYRCKRLWSNSIWSLIHQNAEAVQIQRTNNNNARTAPRMQKKKTNTKSPEKEQDEE